MQHMMPKLPPNVVAFLAQHKVMTLATYGPDGPWASAVFYAEDKDGLVFVSKPSSRHGRNLADANHCAATIQSEVDDWRAIRGIQLQGSVELLVDDALSTAQQRYGEKFPFARRGDAVSALLTALAKVRWYRLHVRRLWFIDNARGFGHRQSFDA